MSHLLNIDESTGVRSSGRGLGLRGHAEALRDRPRSDATGSRSRHRHSASSSGGPKRFEGRKLGVLSPTAPTAATAEKPQDGRERGGCHLSKSSHRESGERGKRWRPVEAARQSRAARSVLYDAVALLPAKDAMRPAAEAGGSRLCCRCLRSLQIHRLCPTREMSPLEKANVASTLDAGVVAIDDDSALREFLEDVSEAALLGARAEGEDGLGFNH